MIGIDEFNLEKLHAFENAQEYEYHSVLEMSDIQHREKYPMEELMNKAVSVIESLDITPDAIVGFWNFPVIYLTPLLAKKYDLPHLPLDALIKCEHKYLSRKEQQKVIPDMKIKIWVDEGARLSEMYDQDSYSYKLASVYLGANDKDELYEKRERCFNLLNFKIDPVH